MAETADPQQNRILDALSPATRGRLLPHLQVVELPLGKVLYESGDTLRYIYFPTDSIVSLLYVLQDGASAEIAVGGKRWCNCCPAIDITRWTSSCAAGFSSRSTACRQTSWP